MSPELVALLMFGATISLLLTGRHIFIVIAGVATISALTLWGPRGGAAMVYLSTYSFTTWGILLAVPLFLFMGYILSRSGVADDLYQSFYHWMGGVRGGLAMGAIGLECLNAAMMGETAASTATGAVVSLPPLLKRKYDKLMITGAIQAGGALGILIPPSISFIVYGMISRQSIGHLWVAGILPGFLLASMYVAYIGIRCRLQPHLGPPIPLEERVGWKGKFLSLRSAVGPVILIFSVIGLLLMGVTSILECAAIGAAGALVLAAIRRSLNWELLREVMTSTLQVTSFIMWIFVTAILFAAVYDGLGAVHAVENLLGMWELGRWGQLIFMQASFLLMGTILDDYAMLIIVAPLYIPIVARLGFNLVWFGVLYVINCQMAYLTPPFGYNLFIMRGVVPKDSGITLTDIYKSVIPFVAIQATCLGIVMAFPQIALWLPGVIFG